VPYRSPKQRRLIYAKAAEGQQWARRFIREMGETPPPVNRKQKLSKHLQGRR
jgi:hypothetical protein